MSDSSPEFNACMRLNWSARRGGPLAWVARLPYTMATTDEWTDEEASCGGRRRRNVLLVM